MLENQFIQSSASIDPIAREIPIPIKHNALTTYYGHYYSAESLGENDFLDTIEIVTPGGKVIDQITDNTVGMCLVFHDLSKLAPCECFRIKVTYIINGSKEEQLEMIDLIVKLFVDEDEIMYDGLTFSIKELNYADRAVAGAYARMCAYYA
jgi:hypothetical protein